MRLLRFTLWNIGVRVCDHGVGRVLNGLALWWERKPGREARVYGCMVHPDWLLAPYDEIPESWWDRFGWRKA